jgi:integrase
MNEILYSALNEVSRNGRGVFLSSRGRSYKSVRNAFEKVITEANIEDFTFHDLRRKFVSW